MSYWQPRVLRHHVPNGDPIYAIHEVYFGDDGRVESHTVDACSPRMGSIDALHSWIRDQLEHAGQTITCGDLRYAYDRHDVARWLDHIADDPIDVR